MKKEGGVMVVALTDGISGQLGTTLHTALFALWLAYEEKHNRLPGEPARPAHPRHHRGYNRSVFQVPQAFLAYPHYNPAVSSAQGHKTAPLHVFLTARRSGMHVLTAGFCTCLKNGRKGVQAQAFRIFSRRLKRRRGGCRKQAKKECGCRDKGGNALKKAAVKPENMGQLMMAVKESMTQIMHVVF